MRLAGLFYAALLGVAVLWAAFAGESLFYASVEAQRRGASPLGDAAAGLGAAAVAIALSHEFTRRSVHGERLARALAGLLGRLSVADCAWLAVVSGVGEEAFFRGALQPRVGLVAASLIFGLAHFVPRREFAAWTVFSVAAGFLLGGLFELTGNLIAPVVAHAAINAVNLRLLSTRYA